MFSDVAQVLTVIYQYIYLHKIDQIMPYSQNTFKVIFSQIFHIC